MHLDKAYSAYGATPVLRHLLARAKADMDKARTGPAISQRPACTAADNGHLFDALHDELVQVNGGRRGRRGQDRHRCNNTRFHSGWLSTATATMLKVLVNAKVDLDKARNRDGATPASIAG